MRAIRTVPRFTVALTKMGMSVRSAEQHLEERSIGSVSGSGSATFGTEHNDFPFRRTNAPSPCSSTLLQQAFKDRQLTRRHSRPLIFAFLRKSAEVA
jgi:hypothetical protein